MTASERIEEILKLVAEAEGVQTCEIFSNKTVFSGDGVASESFRGTIQTKGPEALKSIKVFIKVKPSREMDLTGSVFINEINFYSKIYPELDKFQKLQGVGEPFDNVPKFFCGSPEESREFLALADLQAENYTLYDKSQPLDEKHLEALFATYGKFHALTFAYKATNPDKYREITAPVIDVLLTVLEHMKKSMKADFQTALDYFKETNQQGADKVQMFLDDFETSGLKGCTYEGPYSAWTHGDCWSNNMLFKYLANGDLADIKLLDHQCGRDSTPVHDLAYFFYSGASKSDFDKLDYYLDLYYQSFSKFAKELGADPDKLLPLEVLKSDWKKYSLLGIYMAVVLWEFKLLDKSEFQARIAENTAGQSLEEDFFDAIKKSRDHPSYKQIVANLLIHAIEYGVI